MGSRGKGESEREHPLGGPLLPAPSPARLCQLCGSSTDSSHRFCRTCRRGRPPVDPADKDAFADWLRRRYEGAQARGDSAACRLAARELKDPELIALEKEKCGP